MCCSTCSRGGSDLARYVIALTGASGIVYGVRLTETLAAAGHDLHVIVSHGARDVARHEMGVDLDERLGLIPGKVTRYSEDDTAAAPASGSFPTDGMFVCPMSLKTGAAIANGYADNLATRAALVTLKETRPLVVVPRETPLDLITLRNWVTLKEAGARLVPAMPGFYHRPATIDALVDHVVGKALDQMGVAHSLYRRWDRPPRDAR